ncbi:FAD-dependent monooxygenase [Reyranella aquatilis]|uniref:FAD-dependent monooxygenase n=1 Tax=Reyranella aquatilis TaxID=2035356 RepID=A0ABS8KZ21_9HYPH|nr:NAD(P)/FAD-dependent oxidoreductase [Reyranella aquatilis]MCC8431339.1 FAD-dependent monooxygenase [Reyranella aquatilis]
MALRSLEVGIMGCGVAGQAAASFLADSGHRVSVLERFREPRPVGAGLLLQPTGLAVLRALGLVEAALSAGARIDGLFGENQKRRPVLDLAYGDLHPEAFGLGIRRSVLFDLLHHRLLASGVRLVTDTEIIDVVREGARAIAVDALGGRHGPFDLLVVADGAHSLLRERLMPAARAPLYPWGCIWTTVDDSQAFGAVGLLRQRVAGSTMMMGLLPVAPDKLTMFWSLPVADLAAHLPLDLDTVRDEALWLWPEAGPTIEYAVAADDFSRATYRHVALPRWNDGPVLFMGDAAHGTSPQLGQGANLGLLDAHALARSLAEADDLPRAMELFAQRRGPPTRFYRRVSHLLTPFFQSDGHLLGVLRDLVMPHACQAPLARPMMTTVLAGLRRGWFATDPLDAEGRYLL